MRGTLIRKTWRSDPPLYAPAKFRKACTYDAFVPYPLEAFAPDLPGEVAGVVSDAEKAIAELNRRAGPELAPLARLLLRTESIASSKIEGMQVDARTLARAEANQDTGRRIGPEAAEILGNIDAMQLAIELASSKARIEVADIVDVHKVLMANAPNRELAGKMRDFQNWIGGNDYNPCGAAFVPPPPEYVAQLLDDVAAFCNLEVLPPVAHAALVHAQFETIHPFGDGNGRTGRALVQIILRRRGLAPAFVPPVSVVLASGKDRYIQGLTWFREDRIGEWVEAFAVSATRAADLASRYVDRVAGMQEEWRDMLRQASNPRVDAAAWTIIDVLPAHPVVTIPVAVAATGRSKPSAKSGIDELVLAGVLRPLGQSTRNLAWEVDGLLDLIVDLEAGV